jgi:hypothetical protein
MSAHADGVVGNVVKCEQLRDRSWLQQRWIDIANDGEFDRCNVKLAFWLNVYNGLVFALKESWWSTRVPMTDNNDFIQAALSSEHTHTLSPASNIQFYADVIADGGLC